MKSDSIPLPTEKVVKSGFYFPLDDLEKFKPVIIEYFNQKNNKEEFIYTYIV